MKKKNINKYVLLRSLKFQLLSEIPPSLYSQMYTPDPSSANEEPPSLVPVTHPTWLPFVSFGGAGVRGGGNWPSLLRWKQASCLGTQNRLSVCVCSAARSKGHAMFRHTHTNTHTYIEGPLHSSTSPRQSVQLPGKGNYLLLCLSSGFQSAQLPALRGNRDSGKFVGFIFTGFYSNISRLSDKHDSTCSNIRF